MENESDRMGNPSGSNHHNRRIWNHLSHFNGPTMTTGLRTPNSELPATQLTKREHACIALGIPETGDAEIDGLIRKAERRKLAALALTASSAALYEDIAIDAVKSADALIEELSE